MKKGYLMLLSSMAMLFMACGGNGTKAGDAAEVKNESVINIQKTFGNNVNVSVSLPIIDCVNADIAKKIEGTVVEELFSDYTEGKTFQEVADAYVAYAGTEYEDWLKEEPIEAEYNIKATMEVGHKGYICLVVELYENNGAAHPYVVKAAYTFDPATGERLVPDDVFKSEFDDYVDISVVVAEAFVKHYNVVDSYAIRDMGYFDECEFFYVPSNFCVGKEKTTLVYPLNEISSYPRGYEVIEIPTENFKNLLK